MRKKTKNKGFAGMLVILIAGMIVIMLNQTIINIVLPKIMAQFEIDATTAQWLSTVYMLVVGILIPISAFLEKRFSYKSLFIASMLFFTAGSFACAVSTGFELMLTGRIFQAVGGGILMPLSMNIFLTAYPPERRGAAMGTLGLGMILAPALGPTASGFVIEYYNWSVLFYAMAAIGLCVLIVAFFFFNFESKRGDAKLDVFGIILSTIGFGSLLYAVSEISSKGWSAPEIIAFFIVSAVSLASLVLFERKRENPLLNMKVFKNFNYSYTLILNVILQVGLYGAMLLLPIYLQMIRGFSALAAGLLLLPGSLLLGVMGIVTGKLYDKYGFKLIAIVGITITTAITYMLSTLSMETSYTEIMILYTIRSFGMAFVMMPIMSASIATIPIELVPHANALSNTLKQVASSVGTAVLVVVMSDQAKNYIKDLGSAVTADSAALATVHGIDIAFFIATIISAVSLVLAFFYKNPKKTQQVELEQ